MAFATAGMKRTPEARDGQVVVRLDSELTIKRLSRTNDTVRLLPQYVTIEIWV